jgi:anti-sigma regulatory factor (Ser/Thr protein kinase)
VLGSVEERGMAEISREDQPRTVPGGAVQLLERKFDRTSLASLRGELTGCGAANGLADLALTNFVLAINEITTNAVRHAGGFGQLRLWRDADSLWCEVLDDGPGIPRRYLAASGRPEPGQIGGHGLWLARHICDSVDINFRSPSGTRVLMRYLLPTAAS